MCDQLEIDGGGWTKGPFFSKKRKNSHTGNCFHLDFFLTSFIVPLAGLMNAGSIFFFFFFFLNVETWQSHDAWCNRSSTEKGMQKKVFLIPSQPNQLCMRVRLYNIIGRFFLLLLLLLLLLPSSSGFFRIFKIKEPPPPFPGFCLKINIQNQK